MSTDRPQEVFWRVTAEHNMRLAAKRIPLPLAHLKSMKTLTAGTRQPARLHGRTAAAHQRRWRGDRCRICTAVQHAESASETTAPRSVAGTATAAGTVGEQPQRPAREDADSEGDLPAPVALKEWAVVCAALASGEQTVRLVPNCQVYV